MNFTDLPDDIKLFIFHINKDIDRHNKELRVSLNEMIILFEIAKKYLKFIEECVGISIWEHESDYEYWIELEKNEYLKNYQINDIQNKSRIIKYIIRTFHS